MMVSVDVFRCCSEKVNLKIHYTLVDYHSDDERCTLPRIPVRSDVQSGIVVYMLLTRSTTLSVGARVKVVNASVLNNWIK